MTDDFEVHGIFPMPIYVSDGFLLDDKVKDRLINESFDRPLTNFGGNKTSQNHNLLEEDYLSDLKNHIQKHINIFGYEFFKITNDIQFYITQSWCNFNSKGQAHHLHKHSNSFFSGTYYIKGETPITFRKDIESFQNFEFDFTESNSFNSSNCHIPIKEGRIILFPSVLSHFVEENRFDTQRVSLSFNCFFNGEPKINENNLSYLNLSRG
tara:strand:+ start:6266 stop:6895 length:630 start_codon:yes stop_codon:yes gene_type:complete